MKSEALNIKCDVSLYNFVEFIVQNSWVLSVKLKRWLRNGRHDLGMETYRIFANFLKFLILEFKRFEGIYTNFVNQRKSFVALN